MRGILVIAPCPRTAAGAARETQHVWVVVCALARWVSPSHDIGNIYIPDRRGRDPALRRDRNRVRHRPHDCRADPDDRGSRGPRAVADLDARVGSPAPRHGAPPYFGTRSLRASRILAP